MIKLVKPGFVVGKEKRFYDFIKNLGPEKIALISHVTDLDGVVSASVVNKVVSANVVKFVNYNELDEKLVKELKEGKFAKVIFTDLMIKNPVFIREIEKFAEILIIDHHPAEFDYNSDKTVFINAKGYCAAYLCYYLFSKTQNLEKFDWLVACASISDYCYFRNRRWMKEIFEKYGDEFVIIRKMARERGVFWDLTENLNLAIVYFKPNAERVMRSIGNEFRNIGDLENFSNAVRGELFVIEKKFDMEKLNFNDGFFFEFECVFPIKSLLINKISRKYSDKTIIIGEKKGDYYSFSSRRQDGKIDLNLLVRKLIEGFENGTAGGHPKAAAGDFPVKYLEEFKKRLKEI